jgi:hypothetical protein
MTNARQRWMMGALVAWAGLTGNVAAEPINFMAGQIGGFTLNAVKNAGGNVQVQISFGSNSISYVNGATVGPFGVNLSGIAFPGGVAHVAPGGGQAFVPLPSNAGTTAIFDKGSTTAGMSFNFTNAVVYTDIPAGGMPTSPFPTTPPGPNGLTFLGYATTTGNTTDWDLSLFTGAGPGVGGLVALSLVSDSLDTDMLSILANGGTVTGTGSFQLMGGSPGNSVSNVPEPATLAVWGLGLVGLAVGRYTRRPKAVC